MLIKYIISISIFLILALLYIKIAKKIGIVDRPNERSAHTKATIRGLGVIFFISILLYGVFFNFNYPYFLSGILILGIISFLDDLFTLRSTLRLPFQLIGVFLISYQLVLSFDLGESLLIEGLIIFFGLGFLNAFNFMDGINGITGLYALVVINSFWCVDWNLKTIDHNLFVLTTSSIVVFLFFNFRRKALAFSGDVGSITIAGLLFFIGLAISSSIEWKYLLFFSLYGLDSGYTFIYRALNKENIFKAHKLHFYQLLIHDQGMSHLFVSVLYAGLQLLLNILIISFDSWLVYFFPIVLISIILHLCRVAMNKGIIVIPNNKM